MSAPLPFSDFLAFLRKRGFDIGLPQHLQVARLCEALGDDLARDRQVFSRSVAGLLARNAEEKQAIEQLFFEHYAPVLAADEEIREAQPDAVRQGLLRQQVAQLQDTKPRRWMRLLWVVAALLVVMSLALLGYRQYRKQTAPKPPVTQPEPSNPKGTDTDHSPKPVETMPDVGDPIRLFHWQEAARVIVPLPLGLFVLLYLVGRRRALRTWAQKHWRSVRNDLGGAQEVEIDFGKLLPPALDRGDLEDMATILGRSDDRPPSRELDGEQTVRATLSRAALPTLIFKQQAVARTVLVLCDVSSDMLLWRRKCDALIDGLTRRGVPLIVRYFDGDAEQVSERPFGRTQLLSQVQRLYPDAALLVVSAGVCAHDLQELGKLAPWLSICERFRLRVWLHPVLNRKVWRKTLRRADFPLRVLPMSRKGMLAAAYDLAQEKERRRHIAKADAASQRSATSDDTLRLLRLLTMWPDAPLELGEYLLHRFCPGLPEDTLLHVWATSQDMSGQRLRFAEEDLCRWLSELQESEKHLQTDAAIQQRMEERVRRDLLRILRLHEPKDHDTTGHMKWRLRCALQQVYLHDPDDHNVNEALATLGELAKGPLWDDVADAMAGLGVPLQPTPRGKPSRAVASPAQKKLQQQVLSLIRATAGGKVSVPTKDSGPAVEGLKRPGLLRWPSFGELAVTLLTLMLCVLGVYRKGVGKETLEHVEAYRIEKTGNAESPQAELLITSQREGSPNMVTLCRSAKCSEQDTTLTLGIDGAKQTVMRQSADRYYHVRAKLPSGAWAYSKQILIPGYQPPPMGELLVHFLSEGKEVSGVSFSVTDATGKQQRGEADQRQSLRVGPVSIAGEHKPYPPFAKDSEVKANAVQVVSIDLGEPPPPPGMVKIPADSFQMGSNDGEADEKPVHRVTLPTYYLDQYEVTMEQYQACVKAGGCTGLAKTVVAEGIYSEEDVKKYSPLCNVNQRGRGRHPVNCVDWNQAAAYCKWAGKRLPTEEEWEYAARGTDGRKYPWGKEEPRAGLLNACGSECVEMFKKMGLTSKQMYSGNDGWETTAPVGSVKGDKSPFGVFDLGGNVTEWVQDWYRDNYRTSGGPTKNRSLRGASWDLYDPSLARAPNRFGVSPVNRRDDVGFRCARTK